MPDLIVIEEQTFQGIAVSPGIAIAPLHAIASDTAIAPDAYHIQDSQINSEQQRFGRAVHLTKRQLSELETRIRTISGEDEARIFEAHQMVLDDNSLINKVIDAISNRNLNAEYAFFAVMQNFLEAMRRVQDPYLAERTVDLEDVCQRVIQNFDRDQSEIISVTPEEHHIIVSHDLTPSDTAMIDRNRVLGFATELGSVNSHTAILARSLGIPAIVNLGDVLIRLKTLSLCILDGYAGKLIVNPTEETVAQYKKLQSEKAAIRLELEAKKDKQSITLDGFSLTLSANIEFNHELEAASASGAQGIGLYRTEFFLLNGDEIPDEEAQTEAYIEAVKTSAPHQVIFRTLDAGGDKLPAEPLDEPEPNPFLGWRGIRVSLDRPEMFRQQLRAILRASAYGKIGIMFPFISGVAEVRSSIEHIEACKAELMLEGTPIGNEIEIGAMIEIPSAALIAHHIAQEVDFFSIGTNDLVQYTLAVDRVNNHVASLYNPSHPSVLELMRITLRASKKAGIWTGVCGEMAGDIYMIPVLIGMGVQELSVGTHQVPIIREAIRSLKKSDCEDLLEKIESATTSEEVGMLTHSFAKDKYPHLLNT